MLADVYRRYRRLGGDKVLLQPGTGEHGHKIQSTTAIEGIEVRAFVGQISQDFGALWRDLKPDVDIFQRPTDPVHEQAVTFT
ncbi:MAG: methionyl-tRNA synthetase [Candidatus Azotimanducaceae bacterium]